MKRSTKVSRRDFIRVSTLAGGGFALSLSLPGDGWAQVSQALDDTARQFTDRKSTRLNSSHQ